MLEILIWLYGIMGVTVPQDIEMEIMEIHYMRQFAYSYAVDCSEVGTPPVTFDDITWNITPGSNFSLTSAEGELVRLLGWYDPAGKIIYIPFERRLDFNLTTHEILHAFGYTHDDNAFTNCRV